jgi:hypothetical protein
MTEQMPIAEPSTDEFTSAPAGEASSGPEPATDAGTPPTATTPTSSAAPTPPAAAPPGPTDVVWSAASVVVKAAIVALAIDAFANSNSPRFQGKAMRIRALGYAGALFVVPVAWRIRGRREPYPRELDLAVALPLLVDAGGNAVGIYDRAHVDDAIHFANGALLTSVIGAIVTPRQRTAWEAAGVATAIGVSAAAAWEIMEWTASRFVGTKGMNLTYDDTMADLIETSAGAVLGGIATLLRHPARLRQVPGRPGDPLVVPKREP